LLSFSADGGYWGKKGIPGKKKKRGAVVGRFFGPADGGRRRDGGKKRRGRKATASVNR